MSRITPSILPCFLFVALLYLAFPATSLSRDILQGRKLYQANCASCHGINAKGSVEAAKALQVDPLNLDLTRPKVVLKPTVDLVRLISGGHGKMPKQRTWLNPAQIRSVISYLQSLQKAYVSGIGGSQ